MPPTKMLMTAGMVDIEDYRDKRTMDFPPCGYRLSTGWWLGHPSEKYESQLGWLFPIYGKIKNVPNPQPVYNLEQPETGGPRLRDQKLRLSTTLWTKG